MAKKAELSWIADQKCWAKKVNGKRIYLSQRGTKKTDKLEKQRAEKRLAYYLATGQRWPDGYPFDDDDLEAAAKIAVSLNAASVPPAPAWNDNPSGPAGILANIDAATEHAAKVSNFSGSGAAVLTPPLPATAKNTVSDLIDVYLAEQLKRVQGLKSPPMKQQSYRDYVDKLEELRRFTTWVERPLIHQFDNAVAKAYRERQELVCSEGFKGNDKVTPHTAKKRLQFCKGFFEWAEQEGFVSARPSFMGRKFASLELPEPLPLFWTPAEIRKLWKLAPEIAYGNADENGNYNLLRLCIALGLNAAYTPTDIATLRHDMLDRENGLIFRKRNKTKGKSNGNGGKGVIQTCKLWGVTVELLKLCSTEPDKTQEGGGLVLIGAKHGSPLVWDKIWSESEAAEFNERNPNAKHPKIAGKTLHTDTVTKAFNKVLHVADEKAKGFDRNGRSFKHLRKSGPQEIFDKFHNEALADMLMAHKPLSNGVNAHYLSSKISIHNAATCGVFDELYSACDYLGELYGLKL